MGFEQSRHHLIILLKNKKAYAQFMAPGDGGLDERDIILLSY